VTDDLRTRIARDLEKRDERPPASEPPHQTASGGWQSPAGNPLERVFVVSWSRPPEQDGVPTTAFFEPALGRYWLHEGGGISGQNLWYGPFPLAPP
jgi:hypothetical protein